MSNVKLLSASFFKLVADVLRLVADWPCQVETHQAFLATEVEPFPREHRRRPAGIAKLRNLKGRDFFGLFWGHFEKTELAAFTERNEFTVREDRRAPAIDRKLRAVWWMLLPIATKNQKN